MPSEWVLPSMTDYLVTAADEELSSVPNVDREFLLDTLPRYVIEHGPVTVKNCVDDLVLAESSPAPDEETKLAAGVKVSGLVRQGLDWLTDNGYLIEEQNEQGQLLYRRSRRLP
jgi:hypothetical protein